MSYMRYFIATCESVVDAFLIVRISVQFGDHFCTHAQRGQFWMVKKRQLKCPYGWRRGRLVCDLRMSGINDPALRTGRSGKSHPLPLAAPLPSQIDKSDPAGKNLPAGP